MGRAPGRTLTDAHHRALRHLVAQQRARGDWEGEMVWCPIITAQYVIVRTVVGRPLDDAARAALRRQFEATRTREGGWGLHPESPAYVFVTTLSYVALRLLGVAPDEPIAKEARGWLKSQPGGVLAIPTWGKFWLALIDLCDWRAVNPTPPELFLLPTWVPVHPARFYCHTRLIYLGMAVLAGLRVRASLGPLTAPLREELYEVPYESLDFAAHRHDVAKSDLYVWPGPLLRALRRVLRVWERVCPAAWRRRAVGACLERIRLEQRMSAWQGLSPVNGLLNCLALWASDPADPDLGASLDGLEAWRWEDEAEGRRYAGARSNAWDTAFALRALAAAAVGSRERAGATAALGSPRAGVSSPSPGPTERALRRDVRGASDYGGAWDGDTASHADAASDLGGGPHDGGGRPDGGLPAPSRHVAAAARRGAQFLRSTQLHEDLPLAAAGWRDSVRGGWCFSDGAHRWPVSDCTAEAVSALLAAEAAGLLPASDHIAPAKLAEAASFMLARQNADGGFGTYERRRGAGWLERLNPSEMFGQCMTELSYVECTASCVAALAEIRSAHPSLGTPGIEVAIARGVRFLRSRQRPDGSVLGFWGINVTYGIFHFMKGLRAAGVSCDDPALAAAARWVRGAQRADGGWGEHHRGSLEGRYVEHPHSQAVMTSWALLALLEVLPPTTDAIERGAAWLATHQEADGGWPAEAVNGVFFGSAMLDYRLYKSYFPAWALARQASLIGVA